MSFQRHWKKLSLILCACVVFIWCRHNWTQQLDRKHPEYFPSTTSLHSNVGLQRNNSAVNRVHSRSQTLILAWTTFFGKKNWIRKEFFADCPALNCSVTEDKSRIAESDAVIMHERDLSGSDSLPYIRTAQQRWIWLSHETYMNFEADVSQYVGVFNWTMTYRLDADVTIPYGTVRKRANPVTPLQLEADLAKFSKHRKKMVAVRISNCNSPFSDRMAYIRKLEQFIAVDVLGACGTPCDQERDSCNDNYMRGYKFYLAFENSHCKDYITEKLWFPLNWWNNIPIVMGGSSPTDYEAVAPPHSYIHVNHFKSPEKLAEYLKVLDKDQAQYDEYLQWRKSYEYYYFPYCDLCAALKNTSLPVKWYNDLGKWYASDKCSERHPIYK